MALNTGPGLTLGVEGWTTDFLQHPWDSWEERGGTSPFPCPASTPQGSEWQLEAGVHKPAGTGQAACVLFPGPSLVGRTQEYCVYSAKESLSSPASIYNGEIKPRVYALAAPGQVLKYHFWGAALPGQGTASRKTRAFLLLPPCWWWSSAVTPYPQEALDSPALPLNIFLIPGPGP